MKDDLHELIDGELPDDQAAELLHLLSVDPEKRTVFRHQMRLQKDLCRNERHAGLTALEEAEMLDRVSRTIGEPTPAATGTMRRGILMLAVGFLVGSGAGYLGHSLVNTQTLAARPADTVRIMQKVPVPTPVVVNINRDSLARVIADSLRDAQARTAAKSAGTARKPSKAVSSRKPGATNDLTGRPEAQRKKRTR